jgi:hypothetical protein
MVAQQHAAVLGITQVGVQSHLWISGVALGRAQGKNQVVFHALHMQAVPEL